MVIESASGGSPGALHASAEFGLTALSLVNNGQHTVWAARLTSRADPVDRRLDPEDLRAVRRRLAPAARVLRFLDTMLR